jgi:asparagine synthase (glutamine-hydrolysing)
VPAEDDLMCGITGVVSRTGRPLRHAGDAPLMREELVHRGPDGGGSEDRAAASLQIRRLAIIDLAKGDQPFTSPDGRVTIVCNGEIYNSAELRRDPAAAGYPFRSRSDVESVLPLYLAYGADAIPKLEGMFGLAIWDQRQNRLLLARDRAGEKPLFYAESDGELVFGSEPKALLRYPGVSRTIDPVAAATYVLMGYALQPRTMHRDIRKLPPGHTLVADAGGVRVAPYWSADAVHTAVPSPALDDAVPRLREVLRRAVARELMSDVPLGVFVSGGLDSSLLLALVAERTGHAPLFTYTVSFGDPSYDESGPAALVARHFGATHRIVSCDRTNLRRALDVMQERLDEPLGDPAVLPTFLLSEAARRDVKVILSGEGADELFGGYPTYLGHAAAGRFARLPAWLRGAFTKLVFALPTSPGKVTIEFLLKRFVTNAGLPPLERHLEWFGALGPSALPQALGPAALAGMDAARREVYARGEGALAGRDLLDGILLFDFLTYLPDDLLTKVDRATMLASIEARAPFLDREVLELALGLSHRLKVRGINTKAVLREVARPLLPASVLRRKKRGLSVPTATWMNAELKDEVDRLFERGRLAREGWLNPDTVHQLLGEHRRGAANHARRLWPLVMFQRWLEVWG